MCLAVPMRIVSVSGNRAIVEAPGIQLHIHVDLIPDPSPGDHVLVHAGFAIEKLDPEEAAETLALFAEMSALDD